MPSATAREFQLVASKHGGKEIGPPLFFKILRQLGVSSEEFQRLR
jgi:hypothetical protein